MRKLRDKATPDDPAIWRDVSGLWPTARGSYEIADISVSTNSVSLPAAVAAASPNSPCYGLAYGDSAIALPQEYVVITTNSTTRTVLAYDGSTLTKVLDFTNAASNGRGAVGMCKFGAATLFASVSTPAAGIYSAATFGAAFAAIAGSPTNRNLLVSQSNAVLAFSTQDSAWNTSDVGDHTNWTTGESSSGIIYAPGNTSAAVAYGNDVYVFKPGTIHRFTYVGGTSIKWNVQRAWKGTGVPNNNATGGTQQPTQDWAVATNHGIAFYGGGGYVYLFDGASAPRVLNPDTTVDVETIRGVFTYDAAKDVLCIAPSAGSPDTGGPVHYYYSFPFDAWGKGNGETAGEYVSVGNAGISSVVRGDYYDRHETSSKPVLWSFKGSTATIARCSPTAFTSSTAVYAQTGLIGRPDKKTTFDRVTPLMRRRAGAGSASLTFELFRDREDTNAQTTNTIAEASNRKRFDLLSGAASDNFGRFKVTWTGLDVEVDDFQVISSDAGMD